MSGIGHLREAAIQKQIDEAVAAARELSRREMEALLEHLEDDDADNGWVGEDLRLMIGRHLPVGHKDYWKFHCVNCGLWLNGEPEQEGFCQCE